MKLKTWLKSNGYKIRDFAALTGLDYSTVTRYLTGARRPNWDALARIKEATGGEVTPDDFLAPVGQITPPEGQSGAAA